LTRASSVVNNAPPRFEFQLQCHPRPTLVDQAVVPSAEQDRVGQTRLAPIRFTWWASVKRLAHPG